jgi:uncharacterized protein YgbK (DUF1537 family)
MTTPIIAYYGDDFTGSADVMEVLQWFGMRTVLFLSPPTPQQLAEFDGLRAFGVAGCSRAMSGAEMVDELPRVFLRLKDSGAAMVHYKTCSTFDSSPQIGSIGKAIELGRSVFGDQPVPVVIGAPRLGRYQVFGNLFARSGLDTEPYRLDRHPTMSHHPITPMNEADLREVLAGQTQLESVLLDILEIARSDPEDLARRVTSTSAGMVLFDVLTEEHLLKIGAVLDRLMVDGNSRLMVGSSGIEYALTAAWSQSGRDASMRTHPAGKPAFAGVDRLLAITGSCSPVNDRQIAWAEQNGFRALAIDTARLVEPESAERETARVVEQAVKIIDAGASLILHSCRGPQDPRVTETYRALQQMCTSDLEVKLYSGRRLGSQLGRVLKSILAIRPFRRVGVAGGDTSGYIARELGITALEAIAPVVAGSPLCLAHANNSLNGVEFLFKGGQVGTDDVWHTMLHGTM